jgi:hypothetical protein
MNAAERVRAAILAGTVTEEEVEWGEYCGADVVDASREIGRLRAALSEAERMASIGRTVVEWAMPYDPRAAREATPEAVRAYLERIRAERDSLKFCDAIRIGSAILDIRDILNKGGNS